MVLLAETNNVSLSRTLSVDAKQFTEIPAIGDGNCALNNAALALIDLIKRDRLKIEAGENKFNQDRYNILIAKIRNSLIILKQRLALYKGDVSLLEGNAYTDLAPHLEKFINFVETNPDITFAKFKKYVCDQKTREEIGALHVALAPALRDIGVDLYLNSLKEIEAESVFTQDAELLRHDGMWAGHELLVHLMHDFFKVNVNIYAQESNKTTETSTEAKKVDDKKTEAKKAETNSKKIILEETSGRIADAPDVSCLHVPGHWNYMIPAEQKNGLAADLTPHVAAAVIPDEQKLIDENQTLMLLEKELSNQVKNKNVTKESLGEAAAVVRTISENISSLGDSRTAEKEVKEQAIAIAKESEALLTSLRDQFKIDDKKIEDLTYLSEIEKKLVTGSSSAPVAAMSQDEALARSLQNAEILDFLDRHYSILKPGYETFKKPEVDSDSSVLDVSPFKKSL